MDIYVYKLPDGSYTYTTDLKNVPFQDAIISSATGVGDYTIERQYVPFTVFTVNSIEEVAGIDQLTGNLILRNSTDLFMYKKQKLSGSLNRKTKEYILVRLKQDDWGDTYEECLAELQSSALHLETRLLYLLKQKKPSLTLTEIREKIALFLAGLYTQVDLLTELQALSLTQAEIDSYMQLFAKAVHIAKLLYWIEQVWNYTEQVEQQILNATTEAELPDLNSIVFPVLNI